LDILVFLNALTALVVIIDPIGVALIFNALVEGKSERERVRVAFKAIVISMLLLILFALYGQELLGQLGINIQSLRIAGGLLLFYTAFNMITQDVDFASLDGRGDIAVFPMSVPLIAGPGSLTMVVLLYSGASTLDAKLAVFSAVIVVGCISFISLCLASPVKKLIGRTGDEVLRRFLGVLLAALAIQFIADGIIAFSAMI